MPDGGDGQANRTARGRVDRARLRVPVIIALALANLVVAAWVRAAPGPDDVAVELASSPYRFRELYLAATGGLDAALIEGTRAALRRDYLFIPVYTAGIVMLVATTGRLRPLGRRAPTSLAIGAALAAGLFDVFENLATSHALDQMVDGELPDAARVTELAMVKWILLAAVGAYLLVRALGTPRRRRTREEPGRRYRLRGSRDDIAPAATADAAEPRPQEPASTAARGKEPPGLMAQLQVDESVDRVAGNSVLTWLGNVGRAISRWCSSIGRSLFVDPAPDEEPVDLEGPRPSPAPKPSGRRRAARAAAAGPVGIACSGGGIRSASFTLGALQVLRERGVLAKASHVTAVSGGGYLAAGWAIAASRRPEAAEDVFGPGSPEESWLRRHSNLLPDVRTALAGVGRALFGMAVNLVLIWLVLVGVSRPIGWLEHVVHPELEGRRPYLSIIEQPDVRSADAERGAPMTVCPPASGGESTGSVGGEPSDVPAVCIGPATDVVIGASGSDPVRAWEVTPIFGPAVVDVWDESDEDDDDEVVVLEIEPALVAVVDGELTVVREPVARVPASFLERLASDTSNADPEVAPFQVSRQPSLSVVDDSVPDEAPVAAQLRASAPKVDQRSGTTGRPELEFDPWMWRAVAVAVGIYALVGLTRTLWRPVRPRSSAFFAWASRITATAAVATVAVVAVIPWIIHEVPPAVARLVTSLPGPDTAAAQSSDATGAVAVGGAAVLTLATIVRTLKGPVLLAARRWPMTIAKIVVAAVLVIVPFLLFVNSLAIAAANGPGGHLIGLWASRLHFPVTDLRGASDVARWFAVLIALAVWRNINEAHTLSLFPFYKRRMSESFAVERRPDGTAGQVPYEIELAWTDTETAPLPAKGFGRFRLDDATGGPELVLCATANTYRAGEAASGRRATPFTFSSTVIGGPDVGYLPTAAYLDGLGLARRKDVTIPAVLAISGAAFSPGMGKMSLGPIDNLLAVTNARLGVWIPHPAYVAEQRRETPDARWRDRPGWPWFMRELIGGFRLGTPYLYVTDGGHWENLGVVELLRRGCRNIVVISAAGDGAEGFATIGEALALAREELGLEIAVDLDPMRAIWTGDGEVEPPLLRRGKGGAPTPVAAASFRRGLIRDLRAGGTDYGTVVILEANLSAALPWDVATFAEGHEIFPDDPTFDQNFDHRQLESYRRLGRFQMALALHDETVSADLGVPAGPPDPSTVPVVAP